MAPPPGGDAGTLPQGVRIEDLFFHLFFLAAISPVHNLGLNIEHMPYGVMCMAFSRRIGADVMAVTFVLLACFIGSMLWYGTFNVSMLSYLVATLNILSFLWFVQGNEARLVRAARNVFWLSLGVGALQYLGLLQPLEPLLKILIERFHGAAVGSGAGGYRGVTMLETEPSRASIKIILLYIIAFHSDRNPLSIALVVVILTQLLLIRSTTGIFLSLILTALIAMRYARAQVVMAGLVVLIGPLAIDFLQSNPKFAVIYQLYLREGFDGLYTGLAATSGGRFLAIVETTQAVLLNPLGHGAYPDFFARERGEELERLIAHYRTWVSTRPTSLFLNFLYVYGWVPFAILIIMTLKMAARYTKGRLADPILWVLLFYGVFYSPPSSPLVLAAWVLYAYRTRLADDGAIPPEQRQTQQRPLDVTP